MSTSKFLNNSSAKKASKAYSIPYNLFVALAVCWLGTAFVGCGGSEDEDPTPIIATYNGIALHQSEVDASMPEGVPDSDRERLSSQYVDQWIEGQVMKEKALTVVSDLDQHTRAQVAAYERSLIGHAYADYYWGTQKEALTISEQEIESYYETNPDKFVAGKPYYQYFYVKTALSGQYRVVNLIRSSEPYDVEELMEWCKENAVVYKLDSTWLGDQDLEEISDGYYYGNIRKATLGTPYTYAHREDGTMYYDFLRIIGRINPGDKLPLKMVKDRISRILRNQRQRDLLSRHTQALVEQARLAGKINRQPQVQ